MFGFIRELKEDFNRFLVWYEEQRWVHSKERKELAHARIEAHNKAMEEGRNSPYTHPEEYGSFI